MVLGIGDSLSLRLQLGADAGRILLGKEKVGAIIFGEHFAVDKDRNDDGIVEFGLKIEEDQFGAKLKGCCSGVDGGTYDHMVMVV